MGTTLEFLSLAFFCEPMSPGLEVGKCLEVCVSRGTKAPAGLDVRETLFDIESMDFTRDELGHFDRVTVSSEARMTPRARSSEAATAATSPNRRQTKSKVTIGKPSNAMSEPVDHRHGRRNG